MAVRRSLIEGAVWLMDPLLGGDRPISDCTAVVVRQRPANNNRGIVFSAQSTKQHLNRNREMVFSVWDISCITCGGGVEYLHRSPATHRRQRKGSHESETVKYGREYHGTCTRDWLRWRGPAAILNGRPVLLSERAPHINKPATVWQY
jgi:hypothetical protein